MKRIKSPKDLLDDYPVGWPPKEYFAYFGDVTRSQFEQLQALINQGGSETDIDVFLRSNLAVLAAVLIPGSGHHGSWIIPQQVIRPPRAHIERGLKPDYIVGGRSSDGFKWYVLELKGAEERIFTEADGKTFFTQTANRGVFQLLEYLDYCSAIQAYLRDQLGLTGIREPHGVLLIGREHEISQHPTKERLKAAWNSLTGNRLQVRTYDSLIRNIERIVVIRERLNG